MKTPHQILKLAALILIFSTSARATDLAATADTNAATSSSITRSEIWKDPSQPLNARVQDLLSRMTLKEKVSQILANPPAIPRLGIPAYSHRNECLHGVADAGVSTAFPQAIGMAATWDTPLIHQEAEVIATEARAKHNDYVAHHNGNTGEHAGLNFYSPNINIFRDPRWGRGQETYGEDPFLTAQFGVAFITGLQGDDPRYIKALACAKHYAVHSGPESDRHHFDAQPPQRDLYETYLPAFEAAVREGHVGSAMGAYSSLYGVPCCADPFLLTDLLRKQWGFDGVVFSDGGAIGDIWAEHKFATTPAEAAALAVKAGCDVSSGGMNPPAPNLGATNRPGHLNNGIKGGWAFSALTLAFTNGLISEKEIDVAVTHELTARFRLGLFDPPSAVPWSNIGIDQNDTPEHRALAQKVAEESIVLLKNDGTLPLRREKIKRIAVIGPNANVEKMLLGNYHGGASRSVTILEGIKQIAGNNIEVTYARGCPLALRNNNSNAPAPEMTAEAIAAAKSADAVVFVGGIDSTLESEENRRVDFQSFSGGDRTRIELPLPQEDLLKALQATGKPVIFVICSGSPMAMPWEAKNLRAIVQAWYPGEQGGQAVAEVLFGDVNPAGRSPITFYASTHDLPPFDDYSMTNRTYRYFNGKPLFAFGHGLSYTKFRYSGMRLGSGALSNGVKLSFVLKNTGHSDGDEVAQVYFRHVKSAVPQPKLALCGFTRVHLKKGESRTVTLDIPAESFRYWDTTQKQYVVEPGKYELLVGSASDDIRLRKQLKIAAPR